MHFSRVLDIFPSGKRGKGADQVKSSWCVLKKNSRYFKFQRVCSCPSQANQVGHRTMMTTSLQLMTINYSNGDEKAPPQRNVDGFLTTTTTCSAKVPPNSYDQSSRGDLQWYRASQRCTSNPTIIIIDEDEFSNDVRRRSEQAELMIFQL